MEVLGVISNRTHKRHHPLKQKTHLHNLIQLPPGFRTRPRRGHNIIPPNPTGLAFTIQRRIRSQPGVTALPSFPLVIRAIRVRGRRRGRRGPPRRRPRVLMHYELCVEGQELSSRLLLGWWWRWGIPLFAQPRTLRCSVVVESGDMVELP